MYEDRVGKAPSPACRWTATVTRRAPRPAGGCPLRDDSCPPDCGDCPPAGGGVRVTRAVVRASGEEVRASAANFPAATGAVRAARRSGARYYKHKVGPAAAESGAWAECAAWPTLRWLLRRENLRLP